MIRKIFQYEGQMVNYVKKVRQNKKINIVAYGFFFETGYTLYYEYIK